MWGPSELSCTGVLKDADRVLLVKSLNIPVLLTRGRFDAATRQTRAFHQSLVQRSRMVVFEEACREHHFEQPEKYLAVLRGFPNEIE